MPLALHDPRFDTVLAFIRMQSGGVTLDQIRAKFNPTPPVRSTRRLMHSLVTLGILTTTGGKKYCQYHLRKKPGPFGNVIWFHPDSAGGTMILGEMPVPAPVKPRRPRTPKANPPLAEVVQPSDGAAIQPPNKATADKPPPSRQSKGRAVTPLTASTDATAEVAAVVPPATSLKPPTPRPKPQPVPAAPPPFPTHGAAAPPSRSSSASSPPPLPPKYAALFASSVPEIIQYANNRSRAQLSLESAAAIEGLTPPEQAMYIPAAMAQLDALTPDQAAHLGITPAAYTTWRRAYPAVG